MGLTFQSIPPVVPLIIEDLKISHAQAGFLVGIFSIPGLILSLSVGFLADRYKIKNIVLFALGLMIAGSLLVSFAPSYLLIGAGRIIAGAGAMATTIVIPIIISQWFMGKEAGLAMSIFNTGVPLGSLLSFNIMPRLAEIFGWRSSQWTTASFALLALVIFQIVYKDFTPQSKDESHAREKIFRSVLKLGPAVWLIGIAWMFHTGSVSSFLTFSTDFLVRNGYPITVAGFASSLLPVGNLIVALFVGLLIDRFHSQRLFIGVAGLAMSVFYISVFYSPGLSIPLIFAMGFFSAFIPSSVFTSVPQFAKENRLGLAYGLLNTLSNLGNLSAPYVTGFLRDLSGEYELSFWFMSFLSMMITITVVALVFRKIRKGEQPVSRS